MIKSIMKVTAAVFVISILLTSIVFLSALGDTNEFEFTYVTGGLAITGYNGSEIDLTIPTLIENTPVVSIGALAFRDNNTLISISIPGSVTSIMGEAFKNCNELASVKLSNGLKTIGNNAFNSCDSLTSISIPSSVTDIGDDAFSYCYKLVSVKLSSGLKTIGNSAFYSCGALIDITIPSSVTYFGEYAFSSCYKLASITLTSGLKTIGKHAFSYCNSLTSVTIPSSVTDFGEYAFYQCYRLASLTLSSGLKAIGKNAFRYCGALSSISIPSSVTDINEYAFSRCDALTSITIPSSVTNFGDYAFSDCDKITNVILSSGLKTIGKGAFNSCNALTGITIPGSVTVIGDSAFYSCNKLASVTMHNGLKTIGDSSFSFCNALINATIPSSVIAIGNYTFSGCDYLTIFGSEGSYAQAYANSKGIPFSVINKQLSITSVVADKTSVNIGSVITWTATTTGGNGTKSYRFKLYKDDIELVSGVYSAASTYKYNPKDAGTYKVRVYVNDDTDTVTKDSANVIVKPPLSITRIKADKTSTVISTAIIWTATATGGNGTKTYRFKLYKDDIELIGGVYSTASTYKYIPKETGTYKVRVYVNDDTGTVWKDSSDVVVYKQLTVSSVKADKASVIVGSAITWTVTTTGGNGTKAYRFKLFKDDIELISGVYGAASTYKYIPKDAGTYKVRVYVNDDTDTVTKDSANVIVKPPLSITRIKADKTSTVISSAIIWTATATGGNGTKTYRFKLYKDDIELIGGVYSAANTYKYIPKETGTYKVRVYVNDDTGTVWKDSAYVVVNKQLSISSVKADKTSVNVGSAITWTATATGGAGTRNYRFLVYKDGEEITSSKYATSASYKYTPKEAGSYRVRAYVMDNSGSVSLKSADVTVKAPLSITSVKSNVTSIDVGSEITWTVTATGGSGTKSYRFKMYRDNTVIEGGTYGPGNTCKYSPTEAGTYKVRVYVKDSTTIVTGDSKNVIVE